MIQAIWRLVLGIGMLYAYTKAFVFVWNVPEEYKCFADACQTSNVTTCYIDRPRQKSFVNGLMIGTSIIINCVNLIEIFQITVQTL